eukprot:COSAG02_NODE_2951_length_7674_cov_3.531881_3_plen_111_part_00
MTTRQNRFSGCDAAYVPSSAVQGFIMSHCGIPSGPGTITPVTEHSKLKVVTGPKQHIIVNAAIAGILETETQQSHGTGAYHHVRSLVYTEDEALHHHTRRRLRQLRHAGS